jgi:hypothetical protein
VSKVCLSSDWRSTAGARLTTSGSSRPRSRRPVPVQPGRGDMPPFAPGSERLSIGNMSSADWAALHGHSETRANPQALRRRGRRLGVFETFFGLRPRITWGGKGAGAFGRIPGNAGFARAGLDIACKRGRSGVSSDSSWRGTCRKRCTRARRLYGSFSVIAST